MKLKRMFTTIDTHTNGDTTRIVTGGLPYIPGKTVEEKMNYLQNEADWIRKILLFEPRGKEVQSGAIITEPCSEGADVGVVFINTEGYPKFGDYNIIGVATALIDSGLIEAIEPSTSINIETFEGIVEIIVKIEKETVKEVTFTTSPIYIEKKPIEIKIPEIGNVNIDLTYSGELYAQVEASDLNLEEIEMDKIKYYSEIIKSEVSANVKPIYQELNGIKEEIHVLICGLDESNKSSQMSICILSNGSISRSTRIGGTSARIATLYSKNLLKKEEVFNHKSAVTKDIISGKVLREEKIGGFDGVITEITGRSFITGIHTFLIDPEDTIQEGFKIN